MSGRRCATTNGSVTASPTIITPARNDGGPTRRAPGDAASVVVAKATAAPSPPRTAIPRVASHDAREQTHAGRDNTHVDVDVVVVSDAEEAAARGAELLVQAAAAGEHIFFAGGSTPHRAYELAATRDDDWSGCEVWWGDERCHPRDDDRSNFKLVHDSLLSRLARPPALVHRIRSELGPEAAADEYHVLLDGVEPGFVLLGIGPDGHTASLFPNAPGLSVT